MGSMYNKILMISLKFGDCLAYIHGIFLWFGWCARYHQFSGFLLLSKFLLKVKNDEELYIYIYIFLDWWIGLASWIMVRDCGYVLVMPIWEMMSKLSCYVVLVMKEMANYKLVSNFRGEMLSVCAFFSYHLLLGCWLMYINEYQKWLYKKFAVEWYILSTVQLLSDY